MPLKDRTPLKEAALEEEIQRLREERWEIMDKLWDRLPLTDRDIQDMVRLKEINTQLRIRGESVS